jgi:hypothetical protein
VITANVDAGNSAGAGSVPPSIRKRTFVPPRGSISRMHLRYPIHVFQSRPNSSAALAMAASSSSGMGSSSPTPTAKRSQRDAPASANSTCRSGESGMVRPSRYSRFASAVVRTATLKW